MFQEMLRSVRCLKCVFWGKPAAGKVLSSTPWLVPLSRNSRFGLVHVGAEECQWSNTANSSASVDRMGRSEALKADMTKGTFGMPPGVLMPKPLMGDGAVLLETGLAYP